ncbi:hypothetical protein [Type-D symbiont of Plautia stali]|uniref:hypothetical protein n=1 Tax=Type-D symbiont of Plautia stali TaxID=1560356 RepID=UPI00073EB3B6|nr:hypothetical protein [Type-D symbiont of Plautia stali]
MKSMLMILILHSTLIFANAAGAALPHSESDLTPPPDNRCNLSAGSPVIDYGVQSRWQLQDVGGPQRVTPGKRSLVLSVLCPYKKAMRLSLHGQRADNGELRYGERGSVTLRMLDAQLDGQSVQIVTTTPDGVTRDSGQMGQLLLPGHSFSVVQNGHQVKGKSFTARIELEPVMPESAARVSVNQLSEANLTLELIN